MASSLLSLIKQAILTRTPSDVTIHDRTFVTELLETDSKGDPFALYDFFPRKYRGKHLVLTHHLLYVCRCIVLFFIGVVYAIYDLIHKVVTGHWKSAPLDKEVIKRRIPDAKLRKKLHVNKWRGIQPSTGVNVIIFSTTIIGALISLIFALNFLIREVVIPDNPAQINDQGVVSVDQGALESQHFFLLNAATFWTSSGIAVSEGDKVYVTASGSMYSDINNMYNAADQNDTMKYPRSDFYSEYGFDADAKYCIYGRGSDDTNGTTKPYFGSLLYQICNETDGPKLYNDTTPVVVHQADFNESKKNPFGKFNDNKFHFKADKSGILYFTFNDILLDSAIIDSISQTSSDIHEDLFNIAKSRDTSDCDISDTVQWLKDSVDPKIWFYDNLGEALVNVRIEKSISKSGLSWYKKLLVLWCRVLNKFSNKYWLLVAIFSILAWFGIDSLLSWWLKKKVPKPMVKSDPRINRETLVRKKPIYKKDR